MEEEGGTSLVVEANTAGDINTTPQNIKQIF